MYSKQNQRKIDNVLTKWDTVNKSPYSDSYYNSDDIDWGSKPDGSLRLSDHWNFYSQGSIHCETECGTVKGWYVGVYSEATKKYTLIKQVLTDKDMELEKRCYDRHTAKQHKELETYEAMKNKAIKKGEAKIKFVVSSKKGRNFIKEEYIEVCKIDKTWAYTSKGRKRVFEIIG